VSAGQQVIGYVRVSTSEQGESGLGLDAQRTAIREECSRRGWTLLHIFEDVGVSGKAINGRPALQAALAVLRDHGASGILVSKLDRLSRSLVDFAHLLDTANKQGWNLVALDLGVDLSTPAGEFLASVMAACAQWERRVIGLRTKEALAAKKAQGFRLGRPPCIDPHIVDRVTNLRTDGKSLREICDRFNAEGIPTPRGGVCWRPSSLHSMVLAAQKS